MKKIFAMLAVLLVFSVLLSGCIFDGTPQSGPQDNAGSFQMTPEELEHEQAMRLFEKALEENDKTQCEKIGVQDVKEMCLSVFQEN